jgi:hypothetical protein
MSIGLIVARRSGRPDHIKLDEWQNLIASHQDLRIRSDPYVAFNPRTGQELRVPAGEADSEFLAEGEWLPFLRFSRGTLTTKYVSTLEDPRDPVRNKIAQVASELGAVISTDSDDAVFDWRPSEA